MDKWVKIGVIAQSGCLFLEAWAILIKPHLGGPGTTMTPQTFGTVALILCSLVWLGGVLILRRINSRRLQPPERLPVATPRQVDTERVIADVSEATRLHHYADVADTLNERLETLWHHWDGSGFKLVRPDLSSENQIDFGRDWNRAQSCSNELIHFAILYNHYVETVRSRFPQFCIHIVPSDREYLEVRRGLKDHAEYLRVEAENLLSSAKGKLS
jgi:hypothetical protein